MKLKILHLEDVDSDAEIVRRHLKNASIDSEIMIVDKKPEFVNALREFKPDVVLSDHSMPSFNSVEALQLMHDFGSEIPFILVTGAVSEEFAAEVMKEGASDYLLKDRLERLPSAIVNAVQKAKAENERKHYLMQLEEHQRELEQKIAERTAELQEANKELESFNHSVSHDLKAPLRIIRGFIELLNHTDADNLSETGKEHLHIIESNARRMNDLINALLEFSRSGKQAIVKRELDMTTLVHVVIEEMKKMDSNFRAEIKLNQLQPCLADARLIKQVWTNLISNAIKYSSKRQKPEIEIGMKDAVGEKLYYIKDNGTGFDMKQSEKIFNVFQRLHRLEEFDGTGVGLAIVERIIKKHGGEIWAVGKVDKGATFYFTLG